MSRRATLHRRNTQHHWFSLSKTSPNDKRKALLHALGTDRNYLCVASDVYRKPDKRHSFGKWIYQAKWSNDEQAVYKNKAKYVIVFRGTKKVHDNMTNIKMIMGKFFKSSRFQRDLGFVKDFQVKHPNNKIILVGHSLGGRLASEIAKQTGCEAITFNEARVPSDVGAADNHDFIRRYRTKSDPISALGILGTKAKQTHFLHLPGHGHSIRKTQRLICHGRPVWHF